MVGIYSFRNKYNQKRYIGQSKNIESRYKAHLVAVNNNIYNNYYLYNAIKKYGIDAFDFEILVECIDDVKVLDYWEKFYIKYYCTTDRRYGYNISEGGQGCGGCKHTDEYKKYMSEWMKINTDKIHTPEANEKNRISHTGKKYSDEINAKKARRGEESWWFGKHHTDETKEKIRLSRIGKSSSFKGKHHTDETKEKISKATKGRKAWNKGIKMKNI